MTVRGLIDPSLLGPTLMHEHLFLDISKLAKKPSQKKDIEHWEKAFYRSGSHRHHSLQRLLFTLKRQRRGWRGQGISKIRG